MSARGSSTRPTGSSTSSCGENSASRPSLDCSPDGISSGWMPNARTASAVASPTQAILTPPKCRASRPCSANFSQTARTALTEVKIVQAYRPSTRPLIARSICAGVRGGSTAIVGTSHGIAPYARSRSLIAPACSLVRGTSTFQPYSGRFSHQRQLVAGWRPPAPISTTSRPAKPSAAATRLVHRGRSSCTGCRRCRRRSRATGVRRVDPGGEQPVAHAPQVAGVHRRAPPTRGRRRRASASKSSACTSSTSAVTRTPVSGTPAYVATPAACADTRHDLERHGRPGDRLHLLDDRRRPRTGRRRPGAPRAGRSGPPTAAPWPTSPGPPSAGLNCGVAAPRRRSTASSSASGTSPVVDDVVGGGQRRERAAGEQARVAGAGPDEGDAAHATYGCGSFLVSH